MANKSIQRAGTLRFVGGPLDGHVEDTNTPLHEMPEVLGILISSAIIEMLTTQRLEHEIAPTSLAFYQQAVAEPRQYSFVGSTSPEAIELNSYDARR
jgi:hypothetical protein